MKKLTELSIEEYKNLDKIGFLYEVYPEATGNYKHDVEQFQVPRSIGKDEWYCMWYECVHCSSTSIASSFKYCPDCGKKLYWGEES